ncbi:MAG: DUF302 domain-containing protein [Proteobacteria bacterium]|nr:DUF302 domain-containing protein [Pseudomonadota bacterium]
MVHVIESEKSVGEAARDLEEAVKAHGFGVLHVYDLKAKLAEKGVDLPRECRILEVCNPRQAARVLAASMSVSLALPCRISVYEDGGKTKIGTLLPGALLEVFPGTEEIKEVATEVETTLLAIMADAR